MVNTYQLVNPHIAGTFDTKIKAKNSKEASNIFYKNLSEHFNNSVPSFHFTIQKGSSGEGKYYHFAVKESRKKDEVNFSIKGMKIKGEEELIKSFKTKLENFKAKFNQDGGKHSKHSKHDDSSDSDFDSSSSNDYYRRAKTYTPYTQPIYYWWYDPFVYRLDSLYIPTFYSYVTPYIELSFTV